MVGSQGCSLLGRVEAVVSRCLCVSSAQRSRELAMAALSGMFSLVSGTFLSFSGPLFSIAT